MNPASLACLSFGIAFSELGSYWWWDWGRIRGLDYYSLLRCFEFHLRIFCREFETGNIWVALEDKKNFFNHFFHECRSHLSFFVNSLEKSKEMNGVISLSMSEK